METNANITPQYPDFGALLESIKENGRRMDENYARYLKEQKEREAKQDARLEKISADTNKAIKDMKNVFNSQWGRLVEALCKPAAFSLFKSEGIEVDRIYEGVHKVKDNGQDVMEIDVALCDTTVAVIVEVKSRCGNHEIDHFLKQMEHCKEWHPDFADKELRVAIAAIQYDDGAIKYALSKGLYVLKLSGEDTFTMSAPNRPLTF
jgi:Holliday junction resolvase-like predicted endonuclease